MHSPYKYDRRSALSFAASAFAVLASSCGAKRQGRVAVLPKTTSIDYWENLHAGAQAAASPANLRIMWNAPQSETDYAAQALMLEDFIRQKVDGIVLAPSHGSVLASAVRHAKAERIPLVLVDSPVMVDDGEYEAFISSDPEKMGRLAANRMGTVLKGSGEIGVIGVSPTVQAAVRRERAFTDAIATDFPNIRLVGIRYGLSDAIRSREVTTDLLAQNPAITAFFASDSFAVRGALIALRAHSGSRPKLIGIAQEIDLLFYMQHGEIDSLVVQDPFAMGRTAIRILADALHSGYRGPHTLQTDVALATRENSGTSEIKRLTTLSRSA